MGCDQLPKVTRLLPVTGEPETSTLVFAQKAAVLTVALSGIRAQARDDLRSRTITRLAMLAKQECRLIASALCVDDVGIAYPRSVSDEVGGDEDTQHGEDQGDF